MVVFSNKYVQEVVYLGFDFSQRLDISETITEATFSIQPVIGTSIDSSAMLVGSAVINSPIAKIKIRNGLKGCTYELTGLVTTTGGRTLLGKGTFQVI